MHEYVERSMIERKPTHDIGELRWGERYLKTPARMRADLPLVESAHLNFFAKLCGYDISELRGRITTGRIEVDMRVPAPDTGYIEISHGYPIRSRSNMR